MNAIAGFNRDILVSIRPTFVERILSGEKTVELRRRFPENAAGELALIYSSSPVSAVVGYARIKQVRKLSIRQIWKEHGADACISKKDFEAYFEGVDFGFAILLQSVKALKVHWNAAELRKSFGIVPPQSYRYLRKDCASMLSDDRVQNPIRHKRSNRA